ncbi:hypothetical protein LG302_05520 [Halomonas organivorans]
MEIKSLINTLFFGRETRIPENTPAYLLRDMGLHETTNLRDNEIEAARWRDKYALYCFR